MDACENKQSICGPFYNDDTKFNESGLRLLEFASFNDLVLANTFGHRKASRRWTWHSPDGQHHNQIDYILERKHLTELIKICYVFAVVFKQEYQVFYNREKMSLI